MLRHQPGTAFGGAATVSRLHPPVRMSAPARIGGAAGSLTVSEDRGDRYE
jgi:hypothetical protein